MDGTRLVVVVLLAVMAGALLPVLFQLRSTLRAVELGVERTTPRLEGALAETERAAREVNRICAQIDDGGRQIPAFFASLASLSAAVNQVKDGIRVASAVGAALGPAAAAAVHALRTPTHEATQRAARHEPRDDEGDDESDESDEPRAKGQEVTS